MKYFGMTRKGLYILWRTINDRQSMTSFYLFKNHPFFRRKKPKWHDLQVVRSARRSSKIQRASWQISVPGPRKENPEDPWDWVAGVQLSCVLRCDSKSQFPQLKHLEKPSMYHIGLFDRRATWILFIVLICFDLMQMIVYCPIDRPEMGNLWG